MSKIIGLKLTHDGAVALVENGKLIFSTEIEKLNNNQRYSSVTSMSQIEHILDTEGIDADEVDVFVVDGWKHGQINELSVAPYHEHDTPSCGILEKRHLKLAIAGKERDCVSYTHVTGHIIGAYMSSPFADKSAYCVVMDGCIPPRLYHVSPSGIEFINQLGNLNGLLYSIMGFYAGPFKRQDLIDGSLVPTKDTGLFDRRDIPGKLMSWIAKGSPQRSVLDMCEKIYISLPIATHKFIKGGLSEHKFIFQLRAACPRCSEEDLLASVHKFIENKLVSSVVRETPKGCDLIFTGGSALNIKWNSELRNCNHFSSVWVPPFPNDSGNAIGQAATESFVREGARPLVWSVYSGPELTEACVSSGWSKAECSISGLAELLARRPTSPVVFLHGRAEIGPRALGHRSMLMNPTSKDGQKILNAIKAREDWRPVAPIALTEDAAEIFIPGTPDPYMLFDHMVKEDWRSKIPAIVHLDGTARLQTIGPKDCPVMRELLLEFKKITGIGLLCNTSANMNGTGFFPDLFSAMKWGKVSNIWCEGYLYTMNSNCKEKS